MHFYEGKNPFLPFIGIQRTTSKEWKVIGKAPSQKTTTTKHIEWLLRVHSDQVVV